MTRFDDVQKSQKLPMNLVAKFLAFLLNMFTSVWNKWWLKSTTLCIHIGYFKSIDTILYHFHVNSLKALIKCIHLYLSPLLWVEFLSQCEDISLIIWFSGPNCESHLKGKSKNLQYFCVQIFSQILDICLVHSIHFFTHISKI